MNVVVPAQAPGCCPGGDLASQAAACAPKPAPASIDAAEPADPSAYVSVDEDGLARLSLFVDNVHCAGCIATIEGGMSDVPGLLEARVNLSTRRLRLAWRPGEASGFELVKRLAALGYPATPYDPAIVDAAAEDRSRSLLLAMAVAGFAAANVMLLSIAVWSGAEWDMGPATRDLFHWVSALIALPAVAFAGRPFFHSALGALSRRRLNMDVPISLAVILAAAMSLYQTAESGTHAYFDASVTLLFFLLVGRYLDDRARARARSAAENLLALTATPAQVINPDGEMRSVPVSEVSPGDVVVIHPGDRIPVDGVVVNGASDVDTALITGEPVPQGIALGGQVFAGTVNLTGPLQVRSTAAADGTLLSEIVRLMESAEQGRAKYIRLADRAAKLYAPAVHLLGAATFAGWMIFAQSGWEPAMMAAIAVLIITCPCALGLAVPVVQVVASGVLYRRGVLLKAADGLERLARVDTVVFDKTGTLSEGRPVMMATAPDAAGVLTQAAALAQESRHPLSRALVRAAGAASHPASEVAEVPGSGITGRIDGQPARLGSRAWCGVSDEPQSDDDLMELWFRLADGPAQRFTFEDRIRDDAAAALAALAAMGLDVEILSGDRPGAVRHVADVLKVTCWQAGVAPDAKVARIKELKTAGRNVLMVGDGLNDAPALAAGYASLSPAAASDIAQVAADGVFQGGRLMSVVTAVKVARTADRLVKQNFALAILYNIIAVPVAMSGLATPLIAAIAMSSSSIIVSLNALRLKWAQ